MGNLCRRFPYVAEQLTDLEADDGRTYQRHTVGERWNFYFYSTYWQRETCNHKPTELKRWAELPDLIQGC